MAREVYLLFQEVSLYLSPLRRQKSSAPLAVFTIPALSTTWNRLAVQVPVEPFTWVQYQLGHLGPIPFTWVQYQLSPGSYIRWKEEASDFSSTARQPTRPALADTRLPNI